QCPCLICHDYFFCFRHKFTYLYYTFYSTIQMYSTILLDSDLKKQRIMSSKVKENGRTQETCTKALIPVRDALDILSGKWKLPIIIALKFGNKRFSELAKQ